MRAQAASSGAPLPADLLDAPVLIEGLQLYYSAFEELLSCRTDGPIPWTAIYSYATCYNIVGDLREALFHHVRVLDNALLEIRQTKASTIGGDEELKKDPAGRQIGDASGSRTDRSSGSGNRQRPGTYNTG